MLDLSLTLDEPTPNQVLHPGQKVGGRVHVSCTEPTRCNALTVGLEWRTSGEARDEIGAPVTLRLFGGEWAAGAQVEYAFELEVPPGPYSYEGKTLQVRWRVVARANVPWAFDEAVEQPVTLRPWTSEALALLAGGSYRDAGQVPRDGFSPGGAIVAPADAVLGEDSRAGHYIGCGSVLVLLTLLGIALAWLDVWLNVAALLAGGVGGALLLGFGLVQRHSEGKLGGAPEVQLSPERIELGGRIGAAVRFTPRSRVKLERAYAVLRCEEGVVLGSGSSRRRNTLTLHEARRELAPEGAPVEAGEPCALEASFDLPADAPSSFAADLNDVRWTLELVVKPEGAAPWTRDVVLVVGPPSLETLRAATALGAGSS
jgi:hypothetical protein